MSTEPDFDQPAPDATVMDHGDEIDESVDQLLGPTVKHHSQGSAANRTLNHQEENSSGESLSVTELTRLVTGNLPVQAIAALAIGIMLIGLATNNLWLGILGGFAALFLSLQILWRPLTQVLAKWVPLRQQPTFLAALISLMAIAGLAYLVIFSSRIQRQSAANQISWEALGALGEVFGALGQILIAVLALYVAWRQFVISKELTKQQNTITQQQTIDAYFQGIAELVLDDEGLLEDWPQERALAEGRTAAILSSVDAEGKAKIIRFLSSSKLLTPLRRDRRLGRPMFDGMGGYEEDIEQGVRVIDLGRMLARASLVDTDLRGIDLSEANLFRTNFSNCDLTRTDLVRSILCEALLVGADLDRTRLFYGPVETASPRDRTHPPNYQTGAQTGAVVESADFTDVQGLSEAAHYYCCAWGGTRTRETIPGGCNGIPNKLGR
jgi:uncharacterized protein YjbI with pentapeptide repeats